MAITDLDARATLNKIHGAISDEVVKAMLFARATELSNICSKAQALEAEWDFAGKADEVGPGTAFAALCDYIELKLQEVDA